MKRYLFIVCGILLFPLLATGQFRPDTVEYLWPTNSSPYLSGTFGETRSQHFHAALDIKTWGRRGYNVYATRDGRLHRIAIGPGGYGKAIYLKHADGSYSVYAHLLSFEKKIQQLADSLRFRDYSNKIDVVVDSLNIPIDQGELIAYSGATGIGPPHLHFELRTPSERPFNPLLTNLTVPDDIAPKFSGLAVEPLAPQSRIEGRNKLYTRRTGQNSSEYDFGTVRVHGPVGLAVDTFDQANRVHNAYAVYDLKLLHEDQLLYHAKADSFSYDETGQMFLDRIYPLLKDHGSAYQRLYVADGNTLPFYKKTQRGGRLNLPEGKHKLRIVAEDYYGNRSEAMVTLVVTNQEDLKPIYHSNGTSGTNGSNGTNGDNYIDSGPNTWDWHNKWINFNSPNSFTYTVASLDRGSKTAFPQKVTSSSFFPLHHSDLIAIKANQSEANNKPIHLYRVLPGKSGRVYGNENNAYATFQKGSLYDTLSVALTGKIHQPDSVQLNLYPANQPLQGGFELTYILNDDQRQDTTLSFYNYNRRKDRLDYNDTQRGGSVIKGTADKMGTYYLLSDTTAPDIYGPRIYKRADGKWMGMVRAEDNRSGIDYRTAEFYINGVRGIAEFEPEDDRILYYHPDFVPSDKYQLRVIATDMVGNRVVKEFTLNQNQTISP